MTIPFTQYLRPNGRQIRVEIARPAEQEADVAIELCRNGPEVPLAVDKLIMEYKL